MAGRRVVRIEAFAVGYVASIRIGLIEIFLDDDDRSLVTGDWEKDDDAPLLKTALDFLLRDGHELYEVEIPIAPRLLGHREKIYCP